MRLKLTFGFPTIFCSSVSPFTLVPPDTLSHSSWSPHEPDSIPLVGSFEEWSLERYNTDETWVKSTYRGLISLLTKNFKVMDLWTTFIFIWCSTSLFLLNVRFRLTFEFPTVYNNYLYFSPLFKHQWNIKFHVDLQAIKKNSSNESV